MSVISKNAYRILGLDTSATQKEISRRAKEMVNLLKIDEQPKYDTDLDILPFKRTEHAVKDAYQSLTSPTKRAQDYFFWFQVADTDDEKAIDLLSQGAYEEATKLWGRKDGATAKGFIAKRNLAVLHSLLLLDSGKEKDLDASLRHWKEIVESDKFWESFQKIYQLNDEVGTSDNVFTDLRKRVEKDLADFYAEAADEQGDNDIMLAFSRSFSVKGDRIQKDVLNPVFESIHEASERLEKLELSADEQITTEEIDELKKLISGLRRDFKKLKEIGLYDDSQAKTMRDKAANAVRTVTLDLYNNLNESTKSMSLLKVAIEICGTPGLRSRLEDDMKDLRAGVADEKVTKPINDLMEEEKFQEALDLVVQELPKHKKNAQLTNFLHSRVKWAVTGVVAPEFRAANELVDKGNWKDAAPKFRWVKEFIMHYIEYFDFNQEALNDILERLDAMSAQITEGSLEQIDTYRNELREQAKELFDEQFEEFILLMLIDSTAYGNLSAQIPKIKRKNQFKNWAWGIGILIFLIIAGASGDGDSGDSGSSGSGSSAATQCQKEYDALKSQLDSLESTANARKRAGDTDGYNALVPQQNTLVGQVNAKAQECNNL